ncbi:hypothetical protein ACJDU8_13475 [Clostridium sp. WILCCON 0269]|uniref:Nucleoside phosphorylase domain-containing protein n=1 Tax=Candidatus Clostridium eludens TaxID=3381663 RepID=A0ABW8SL98_9CLOT
MVFIVTALYCEAKPFIDGFALKKYSSINKVQVFKNEEIVLVITKGGAINTACSCIHVIDKFEANAYDTFINIGICGSKYKSVEIGTAVLCNKITENTSDKDFYPDMVFKHPFREGHLESFPKIVKEHDFKNIQGHFVDMEGAAFFQAVSMFIPPHRIHCLKVVSDYLNSNSLTASQVTDLIYGNSEEICRWILDICHQYAKPFDILDEKDMDYINEIITNLNLSVSMQHKFKALAKGYKLRNDNLILALEPFTQICCKTKGERKMYFERLVWQLQFM